MAGPADEIKFRPIEDDDAIKPGARFHESGGEFFVAEDLEGNIVGTVGVEFLSHTTAELKEFFARENAAGLLKFAVAFASEQGSLEAIIWADDRDVETARMIENTGFVLKGKRETAADVQRGYRKALNLIAGNNFAEACEKFKSFLADNDLPVELLWAFEEDVYRRANDRDEKYFWIKLPLLYENDDMAESIYERAGKNGFGVEFRAYARCADGVCCGLIVPRDFADAAHLSIAPGELKFSFGREMPEAAPVKNTLVWKMFSFFPKKYRPGNFFEHLPAKNNLQFRRD